MTGPGVDRLVQHSAGSGKSNTIAWLAHGLSRLHTPAEPAALSENARRAGLTRDQPVFHKVIVITTARSSTASCKTPSPGSSTPPAPS